MKINRRSFLKGTAAGTAGAIVACAIPAFATASEDGSSSAESASGSASLSAAESAAASSTGAESTAASASGSWRDAPEAVDDSKIVDTTEADVIVIGAGHAGTATARRLAETSDKTVVLLEAQTEDEYSIIGNDIGHINSEYLKSKGVPEVDPLDLYENWMVRSQNAAHPDLVMQFAQNCGAAVDWFLEDVEQEYLDTMTISYWPRHENMLDEIAGQKFWTGTVQWGMGNEHNMTEVYKGIFTHLADLSNLTMVFDRKGQYLIKDSDRVTGVITLDSEGSYHKYMGTDAVVLAAGDFGANKEMMTDLCVTAEDVFQEGLTDWHDPFGAKDGSGIKMGYWAGGRMEPRPLGSMNGDFVIPCMYPGVGIYLDYKGERYCNEYFGDPTWTGKPAARIKQTVYYTIFDSKLPTTATYSVSGHTCFDPQEANIENIQTTIDAAYAAGADGENGWYAADDLDTLAGYMGLDDDAKTNMIAAVKRYNELCENGRDEDYGKDSRVLFALDTPPYIGVVAGPDHVGGVMVTVGGLMTDKHCNVIDSAMDPIPGLYAVGNCCGRRFGAGYFSPIPGVSIGMALTLGYVLGGYLGQL